MIKKVVETARSLVGTKWRHKGRSKHSIDCVGIIVYSFAAAGVEIIDRKHYGREPWKDGLDEVLEKNFCKKLDKKERRGVDVAIIWFDDMPAPSHIGIIAKHPYGGLSLIHSYSMQNTVEHFIDDVWYNRISHVYRYQKWQSLQ